MDRGEIRGEIHAAIPGLFGAGLSHLEDPVREVLSMENGWMFFQVGLHMEIYGNQRSQQDEAWKNH